MLCELTKIEEAYDYAGPWVAYADSQANIYGGARTGFSTSVTLKSYAASGASASKIVCQFTGSRLRT